MSFLILVNICTKIKGNFVPLFSGCVFYIRSYWCDEGEFIHLVLAFLTLLYAP